MLIRDLQRSTELKEYPYSKLNGIEPGQPQSNLYREIWIALPYEFYL